MRDPGAGVLFVVGIGPGHRDLMTPQAVAALGHVDVVIGYDGYLSSISDLLADKDRIALPLGQEEERARIAIDLARAGRRVAVISSGDPGIYAMASLVLETLNSVPLDARPSVEIVPGLSALNAAAALLGAPLGHDFAVISLSDLLTSWEAIDKRLTAVAAADFVVALFNPQSRRRDWQLPRAREILLAHRSGTTPVGVVRNAYRPGQAIVRTTLTALDTGAVDMFTIVIIGNSMSRFVGGFMVTPRGYTCNDEGRSTNDERMPKAERRAGGC